MLVVRTYSPPQSGCFFASSTLYEWCAHFESVHECSLMSTYLLATSPFRVSHATATHLRCANQTPATVPVPSGFHSHSRHPPYAFPSSLAFGCMIGLVCNTSGIFVIQSVNITVNVPFPSSITIDSAKVFSVFSNVSLSIPGIASVLQLLKGRSVNGILNACIASL